MPDTSYIEPTPASRRKFAALFVAALIVGVALIEFAQAHVADLKTRPVCESIAPFWLWFAFVAGGLSLCATWMGWIARRALKLDQWPLPGTWVLRRTPIKRGSQVKWRAYGMFASAALVLLLVAFSSYLAWSVVHRVEMRCTLEKP